jgi:hypothetical protein
MSSRRESDFERLEQLLREADERAKEANERAERERRRAEDERRRAKDEQRNRQEAGSRAQIEEKTRPTAFEEYIRACHTLLSKHLRIQIDKYLTELGQNICDRQLASEKDLEAYQHLAVEQPTTHIISHLQQIEEARHAFDLGEGIIFENHANTLSDSNEEVQQSLRDLRISSSNPKPRNAD